MKLATLYKKLALDLYRVELTFEKAEGLSRSGYQKDFAPAFEGCLVHTHDAWSRFARDLIVGSSSSVTISRTGHHYGAAPFGTRSDVINFLKANQSSIPAKYRGLPCWHIPVAAISAVNLLNPPNASQISSAIGATLQSNTSTVWVANPIQDMNVVRNFVCHKGQDSAEKAEQVLQALNASNPIEWMRTRVQGVPIFVETLRSLKIIALAASS